MPSHRGARSSRAGKVSAALVALAMGCGSEREYKHETGLAIRIPAEWIETPTQDGGVTLSGREGTPEWRTTINIHSTPVSSDEVRFRTLDRVVGALAIKYRSLGGASVNLRRHEQIGGRDTRVVEVRFLRGTTPYRRVHYVARHRNRIVHLDGTAPASSWDRLEPVLERAVETASWE